MFHDAPVEAAVAVHRHRTRGTTAAKDAAERIRREYQLHRVAAFLLTGTDPASTSSPPAAAPPPADSSPSSSAAEQQAQGGSSACCQCGSSCTPSTPAAPYVRVALQFPDELLSDSVAVVSALQDLLAADPRYAAAMATKFAAASAGSSETASKAATAPVPPQRPTGAGAAAGSGVVVGARPPALDNPHSPVGAVRLFVLADNTFGSCCPDEITAQHYMTDCIVHFGDACMSRSTRLPVLYIQPAFHFDAIAQGSSEGRAEAERGGAAAAAASAYAREALTHAESSVVLGVVERVTTALQRRVAAWRAEQGIEAADVRDVTPRLAVVGTYPTKAVMLRAQQRWLTRSDTPEKDSCVPVDWPRFEERNGVLPGGAAITNPAAVEASLVAEGGDAAEDDWVVNGVRFPRLRSGAAREVQYLLFVGASGSSALVHVLTAEQYNEYHYSEACREFLEWDSGEEETTVPVVTVVNNTFGVDAIEEGGTVVAEMMRPAADALQQQKQSSGSGVESVPAAVLARLDEAVVQWLSTALADGVSALVTGDYVVAQQALQRRVRQRAFNIESVRASSAVGVLVASLAIEGYYELTQQLHQLLRAYGKRSYVIYVGHLNEFKLANFVDTVDCFVAVACPYSRQSHFPEKRDNFMKPIVSPAELLVALTTADDSDDSAQYGMAAVYTTAFDAVLRVLRRAVAERKAEVARRTAAASGGGEGDEEARRRKAEEEERWAASGALVRAGGVAGGGALTVHDSSQGALARLYEREYVGLDPRIGQTPVQAEVLEGKHGIARGYAKEREEQHAEPPVSNYK